MLAYEPLAAAQAIDRAMFGGGHEPGARVVRDTRLGPLFECGNERILRELLGKTDVAHDPCDTCDELRGFDSPDCVDRAMRRGCRHADRLNQVRSAGANRARRQAAGHGRRQNHLVASAGHFSATAFRLASPVSNSLPTMSSMLKKSVMTFAT